MASSSSRTKLESTDVENQESEYKKLIDKLKGNGFLPDEKYPDDQYIHKSLIKASNSLLMTSNGNIYELVHDEKTTKKIIIGRGKDAVVREGRNAKTGEPIAIKLYPLYKKESCPRLFLPAQISEEIGKWRITTALNDKFPNTFVKMLDMVITGDKSTQSNPRNLVAYVITKKYKRTVKEFFEDKQTSFSNIKEILGKIFIKHRNIYSFDYTFSDANLSNILLDDENNPIFCDPESLVKHTNLNNYMSALQLAVLLSLTENFSTKLDIQDINSAAQNQLTKLVSIFSSDITSLISVSDTKDSEIQLTVNLFIDKIAALKNDVELEQAATNGIRPVRLV